VGGREMSKYMIFIESRRGGEQWLDAMAYMFYYFLPVADIPDDKARTHIEENYSNRIGSCEFGYYKLYGAIGNKIIKEGWALRRSGPIQKYNMWPRGELKKICAEPVQRVREFEAIIAIESTYGNSPSCCCGGWNYDDSGFLKISVVYRILRKSETLKQDHYGDSKIEYDYYKIPNGEDPLRYIPTNKDKTDVYEYKEKIISYTPEKHEVLRQICDAGKHLGTNLADLFERKNLEIGNVKMNNLLSMRKEDVT
jgi:hypothetical protein